MTRVAPSVAPDVAPVGTHRLAFRPDIEGLRAVAVTLVVLLHAGVTTVSGGYIGVDVFFVISGFLITSLLIDEYRGTGRVSILGFYSRRARRILPVACVVIAVTVVVANSQLGVLLSQATANDGRWSAVFMANVHFIKQGTDYFGSSLPPSPLQHFWSLAVEEQFYLVWPTVLWGLMLIGRRLSKSALTLALGLIAIVAGSLAWSVHQTALDPTTAYFSPLTRAWELGAGALIALFPAAISKSPAVLRATATWVGLAFVSIAAFMFGAATPFPGKAALLPVVGTVLIIAGGVGQPKGGAAAALGLRPLRWVGKISFSLYLWHWPVLIIAQERSAAPLTNTARVVCMLITLVLSVASFYVIEDRLRTHRMFAAKSARSTWGRARGALLAGAVAIVLAFGVSTVVNDRAARAIGRVASAKVQPGSIDDEISPTASPQERRTRLQQHVEQLVRRGVALHHVPAHLDPPVLRIASAFEPRYINCLQGRAATVVKSCTFGAASARRSIVVFGDSKAMQWMPAMHLFGKRSGYRVVTMYKAACSVPSVDTYTTFSVFSPYRECETWRNDAFRRLHAMKPVAVIMAYSEENTSGTGAADLALWRKGLERSLQRLSGIGARVIQLGVNPTLPEEPRLCLSRPDANPTSCTGTIQRRERVDVERTAITAAGAAYVDTEPWFCVQRRCPVIIDGRIAYGDHSHLSAQYVSHLEPLVAATFASLGLR